jgi:hypothetical protein
VQVVERLTLRPARTSLEELLGLVGLVAMGLGLAIGAPTLLLTQEQPIQAALAALLLWPLVVAFVWGERGPSRPARGWGATLLEGLGAPRELTLVERDGRRWLRIVVGSLRLEELPLDTLVEVERTTLYTTPHLVLEHEGGATIYEPLTGEVVDAAIAAIERWRREAPPPPVAPRCAACHGALEAVAWVCPGCATRLHAGCADDLGRCPTLGCARSAPPAETPGQLELLCPAPAVGDRLLLTAWLVACGLCATLLARALVGHGGRAELVQGALLGLVTLVPLGVTIVRDPRGALEAALGLLALRGRRVLRLVERRLRVEWRLGPLRLLQAELELDAISLEAFERPSEAGARITLVQGEERVRLDDPVRAADLRRLEALVGRGAVDPLADPSDALAPVRSTPGKKVRK